MGNQNNEYYHQTFRAAFSYKGNRRRIQVFVNKIINFNLLCAEKQKDSPSFPIFFENCQLCLRIDHK